MTGMVQKPKVGVMGSANARLTEQERKRVGDLALQLGAAIAARDCILVTGATTGLPEMISRAARRCGALTVGISPAMAKKEHVERYGLPDDAVDLIIYTGFGLKGRNVINVRASDIVIIFGGEMGSLNEFTIAYDEGKIIGVLEGSGGIADHIREIVEFTGKDSSMLILDSDPSRLIDACLIAFTGKDELTQAGQSRPE